MGMCIDRNCLTFQGDTFHFAEPGLRAVAALSFHLLVLGRQGSGVCLPGLPN